MTPKEFRKVVASGNFSNPTAGHCKGYLQTNLLIISKKYADSFEEFAKKNHKAIPVLEVIRNSHYSKILANQANLLNELPLYDIFKDGKYIKSEKSIEEYYSEDLVFFLIGCSFTFENHLIESSIALRHIEEHKNVAMYNTNIKLNDVDIFNGNMVVSMRPIKKDRVSDACVISSHYPDTHGGPIQVGYPEMIGINNISNPDYGDFVEIKDDEIPVFWPCGVTPINVLKKVQLPFAITHSPGYMFIADKKDSEYYV